jgi:hypothetical protein
MHGDTNKEKKEMQEEAKGKEEMEKIKEEGEGNEENRTENLEGERTEGEKKTLRKVRKKIRKG